MTDDKRTTLTIRLTDAEKMEADVCAGSIRRELDGDDDDEDTDDDEEDDLINDDLEEDTEDFALTVAKLDAERERIRVLLNGLEGRLSRVRDALERQRAEALAVGEGSPLWARVEGLQAEENALVRERRAAEKDLLVVEEAKVEASWVSEVLGGFDAVWDVMTPENRSRLVRLLIERVEAVAADGRVVITLRDPSGRVPCEEDSDAERR